VGKRLREEGAGSLTEGGESAGEGHDYSGACI